MGWSTKPDDVDDTVDDNIAAKKWFLFIDIRVWGRATLQNMDKEKLNMNSS